MALSQDAIEAITNPIMNRIDAAVEVPMSITDALDVIEHLELLLHATRNSLRRALINEHLDGD